MNHLKKLSLGVIFALFFLSWNFAQTLNQPANWPNANWTVTGTYDNASLTGNPSTGPNFSFDDDNAGIGSVDAPAAESPVIDLTSTHTNSEFTIEITADIVIGAFSGSDQIVTEYFDADAQGWTQVSILTGVQSGGTAANVSACGGTAALPASQIDITNFTATQLAGFKYRFRYNDNASWELGFCIKNAAIFSVVTCPKPTSLTATNITTTAADLGWTENGSATTWDLEIVTAGTTPTGTPTNAGVTANPFSATGLTPSTSYEFYVRSDCGGGDLSAYEGPFSFTTAAPPCSDPSLGTSANETQTTADLGWTENGTATTWDLEIVATGATPTGTPTDLGVTSNPYTATGLTAGTTYDFYVRADCGSGTTSAYAGPFTFTTAAPACADPSTLGSANETSSSAELSWTENGTATTWDLEIVTSGTTPTGTPTDLGVTANPYTASGLAASTSYDFYVRADCGSGNTSAFVGPFTFTTLASTGCADPTTLTASNITTTSADLGWTENGTATAWDIELVAGGATPTGTPTNTGVTNPYAATALTASTSYDFYVRADCGGTQSNWVGPFNFTTTTPPCNDPSDLGASGIASTSASLEWTENGTATIWNIELLTSGTTPTGVATNSGVSNPFLASGLTASTAYDFYVQADCGNGNESNWVGPFTFTTIASTGCDDPTVLTANNITVDGADLGWTENGSATTWDIEVITAGTAPTGVATNVGVTTNPFTVSGLTDDTAYDFYVRADCGGTQSNWVGPFQFTTLDLCDDPSNLTAANVGDLEADLGWMPNGTETDWELEVLPTGGAPTGVATDFATSLPVYQKTGLTAGTGYDFFVRAQCGSDFSNWVGPFTFQTTANLSELEAAFNVKLAPNPSTGVFKLTMNTQSAQVNSVQVYATNGQLIETFAPNNNGGQITQTIDLSDQAKGMYFLTIATNKGKLTYKVSVK